MSIYHHVFVENDVSMSEVARDLERLLSLPLQPLEGGEWYVRKAEIPGWLGPHTFQNGGDTLFENYRYDLAVRERVTEGFPRGGGGAAFASEAYEKLKETGRYALMLTHDVDYKIAEFIPDHLGTYYFVFIATDLPIEAVVQELQPILGVPLVPPPYPPNWRFDFRTERVRGYVAENDELADRTSPLREFRYVLGARNEHWDDDARHEIDEFVRDLFEKLKASGRYGLLLSYGLDQTLDESLSGPVLPR